MREKAFHRKTFEGALAAAGPAVLAARGRELGGEILEQARSNFLELFQDLPPHRTILGQLNFSAAPTALAFYRAALPLMGREPALDAVRSFMQAAVSGIFQKEVPALARRALKSPLLVYSAFSLLLRRDNWADDPEGWIYKPLPRQPGHIMDFDITRCGVHRYFSMKGAPELTSRAICPLDDWFAENALAQGSRLSRETLISRGDSCCAFRFIGPDAS